MPRTTRTALAGNEDYTASTAAAAFNSALKVLSDAAKRRVAVPATDISKSKPTLESNLKREAEKARSALTWMRMNDKDLLAVLQPQQLEDGTLAFLSKCIALHLYDSAWREALVLKRRLDRLSGHKGLGFAPTRKGEELKCFTPNTETVKELLGIPCLQEDDPWRTQKVQLQVHTLKLLAAEPDPQLVQSAIPYLDFREPILSIDIVASKARTEKERILAARQLETVSRILLSLCPSSSTSKDATAQDETRAISALAAFQLQTTALHARRLWWSLASHQADEEKEMWAPLHRYMVTCIRRTSSVGEDVYQLFKAAYLDLSMNSSQEKSASQITVLKILSSTAQSLGSLNDAKSWIIELQRTAQNGTSSLSAQCSNVIRLAALALNAGDDEAQRRMDAAISCLDRCTGSDLRRDDTLILEISTLRKAALKAAIASKSMPEAQSDAVLKYSLKIAGSCLDCLYKYCDDLTKPEIAERTKCEMELKRRRELSSKLASSFVETAMGIAQQAIKTDKATFDDVDTVLLLCNQLDQQLRLLEINTSGIATKLSALYYNLHITRSKRGIIDPVGVYTALSRSVQVLTRCNVEDKKTGSLLGKMEKLIKHCLHNGRKAEALQHIQDAFRELFKDAAILTALDRSSKYPPSRCFDAEPCEGLPRILNLLHIATSDKSTKIFQNRLLDFTSGLSTDRQAACLELGVALYPNRCGDFVQRVIDVYQGAASDCRRLRVLLLAETKGLEVQDADGRVDSKRSSQDGPQLSETETEFKLYYTTSLSALRALRTGNLDILEASLRSWYDIISERENAEQLLEVVDDLGAWMQNIETIATWLEGRGIARLCVAALTIATKVLKHAPNSSNQLIVITYTRLATQLLHQGLSSQAGVALVKASAYAQSESIFAQARIQLFIAQAEYQYQIGCMTGTQEALQQAKALSMEDSTFLRTAHSPSQSPHILKAQHLVVRAWNVYSQLAWEQGDIAPAIDFARRAVKLSQRIWTAQENVTPDKLEASNEKAIDSGLNISETSFSRVASSLPVFSRTHDALMSSSLWPFTPTIISSYLQLAKLYAHIGSLADATSWGEQARKIAVASQNEARIVSTNCFLADCYINTERLDKAQAYLDVACEHKAQIQGTVESIQLYSSMAAMWAASKEYDDEEETWSTASVELAVLRNVEAQNVPSSAAETYLATAMRRLEISNPPSNSSTKPIKQGGRKPVSKGTAKHGQPLRKRSEPDSDHTVRACIPLDVLEGTLHRRQANSLLSQGRIQEATPLLERAKSLSFNRASELQQTLALSEKLFMDGMESMQADFTYGVLPESTISLPATIAKPEVNENVSAPAPRARKTAASKTSKRGPSKTKKPVPMDFVNPLILVKDCLHENLAYILRVMPISVAFRAVRSFRTVAMFLSAVQQNLEGPMIHPLLAACSYESIYAVEAQRTREILQIENKKIGRNEVLQWPTEPKTQQLSTIRAEDLQAKFIDIIPKTWTAISISMDDTKQDIILTRYKANQSPFIIRLPLSRHKSRDMDEDIFDFASGKAEMAEIIDLANFSAHDAKDMSTAQGKKDWWAARESLDARLKDLLVNIESIWLGGFRGIFAAQDKHPQLLANFLQSLQEILKRHLPTRQSRGEVKTLDLDPRILQLFTGLGDPSDESIELDEPLMDLLYFVVDILQFNGERNAYDEIDFDAICVETIDALKIYHHAANALPASKQHTILILDKSLHLFPWESLPCMEGTSVSRLPSLVSLQIRLAAMMQSDMEKTQIPPSSRVGHPISTLKGFSILNPGGDLKNTQAALQPCLSSLPPDWTHRTTTPAESEMEAALAQNDLFLYFGHGSGAQYIRPRTVKKVERAPVTWLMGCSSSAITDNGEFEPTGMVLAYLQAGAPAVLGTLWDVTDRDCDRASAEIGEQWGLWKVGATTEKLLKGKKRSVETGIARAPKTPGRGPKMVRGAKTRPDSHDKGIREREDTSLPEAVVAGKKACYLQYLNGAAFVVYGVPVYLVD